MFTAVVYVLTSGCGLAASAADVLHVLHVLRHRTSPPHGMDRGLPVTSAASGGAERTRGPRTCTSVSPSSRSFSASPPSGRRGPRRGRPVQLRAHKAYFSAEHLSWLRTGLLAQAKGEGDLDCGGLHHRAAHRHAAGARKKRGATGGESEARAVGRSRGGLPTKVHLAAADGPAHGRCWYSQATRSRNRTAALMGGEGLRELAFVGASRAFECPVLRALLTRRGQLAPCSPGRLPRPVLRAFGGRRGRCRPGCRARRWRHSRSGP